MANHKSAITRIRRNENRAARNHARVSRIRTFIKKLESAIESGTKTEAQAIFKTVQPEIDRGVTKGVLRKATASRKVSRLNARVASMA